MFWGPFRARKYDGGIPGHAPCMLCNWAIKDQEVLIHGGVPSEAIVGGAG